MRSTLLSAAIILAIAAVTAHAEDDQTGWTETEPYARYQIKPTSAKCTGDIQPTICQLPPGGGGSQGGSDGSNGGESGDGGTGGTGGASQ